MIGFGFNDILSALQHVKGGIPTQRLTSRIKLGEHRSRFFGPSYNLYDIKEFDPESDPLNMIVDLSSSLDAGLHSNKRRMLLEAIGFVGATGIRYQDPVGLIGFTDKVVLNLKPRSGKMNFYHLLKTVYDFLERSNPDNGKSAIRKTDFFATLDFVKRYFDKPCFIPVISDFVGFDKVLNSSLFRHIASRHELVFIFLDNPESYKAGEGLGYIKVKDIETGKIASISRRKLSKIEQKIRSDRRELRRELRKMGVYSVVLEYDKHLKRLQKFFTARRKHISTTGR